ncbi:Bcr/CflA family drug resistance efflux transporter [Sphingobacteriaceae bacterium]|nr:Bcr/CflA family drug resistance efflux transporter [Sphingobacteriaceae bacterium]
MQKGQRTIIILILGLLSAIGPFSIDMYLPGFPAIAEDLHTSVDMVAYTLASFFVGICLGQLISGPLLDRFGRKRPLIVGMIVYIIASIGCALSESVEMLIVFRCIQALGGCVTMVAPRAIIRDVFPVSESAKIFSMMILILGVSPIIAPTAGSFLIAGFGWYSVFITLGAISLAVLLGVIFLLPESRQPDPTFSLKPAPILASFKTVIVDRQFFVYTMSGAIAAAGLFAYLAGSPFLLLKFYGVSEKQYGLIFAIIASGLITASQVNNILLKKYTSIQIVRVTLMIQTIAGLLLFIGTALSLVDLYSTIALIFVFLSCQGFNFPNSSALSMAPFEKEAGSASALMGAIQMGFGALAAACVGILNASNGLPMTGVMAICGAIALVILLLAGKEKYPVEGDFAKA